MAWCPTGTQPLHEPMLTKNFDTIMASLAHNELTTFLVLTLEYCGRTMSIPWLLMPWLLMSPGHQQTWHWLCRVNGSLSSTRRDFNHLCHLSHEKNQKYIFMFPLNNLGLVGLITMSPYRDWPNDNRAYILWDMYWAYLLCCGLSGWLYWIHSRFCIINVIIFYHIG